MRNKCAPTGISHAMKELDKMLTNNDVDDWDKEMMKLLNYLISEFVNDCVLEYYGIPVIKKINGNVEVDESKSGRLQNLLFDILHS